MIFICGIRIPLHSFLHALDLSIRHPVFLSLACEFLSRSHGSLLVVERYALLGGDGDSLASESRRCLRRSLIEH